MADRSRTQRKETRYVALRSVRPSRVSCFSQITTGVATAEVCFSPGTTLIAPETRHAPDVGRLMCLHGKKRQAWQGSVFLQMWSSGIGHSEIESCA
jgi:hypothetical protein